MALSEFSYKNIWKIAFPVILGSLAQDIITVVDTAFIGRLGPIPLGAVAIGGIFYLAIVMLAWGFGLGIQIMISRRYGEGKIKDINHIFYHSLFILVCIAIVVFVVIKTQITGLLSSIIQSNDINAESSRYINTRIWGLFAAFININFRAFYIGIGKTKIIGHTTIFMAIVNIVLDYFLIFGKGFFPEMGIEGAALASVIAEYAALGYFILFTRYNHSINKFNLIKPVPWNHSLVKRIFKLSTPTMLQHLISFGAWFLFFVFVEKMGPDALAVSNIIRSIYIILLIPIMGFASATNTLVSYSLGKGYINMVFKIAWRSLALALLGVFVISVISSLMPQQIIGLYTNSQTLINMSVPVFYVVIIASFLLSFGFIFFQALAGTGHTLTALILEIATIIIYLTGIYLIVNTTALQIKHVWMMEIVYGLVIGSFSIIFLKCFNWKEKVV